MYKSLIKSMLMAFALIGFVACDGMDSTMSSIENDDNTSNPKSSQIAKGFTHGIIFSYDGNDLYFAGPPDGPNGEMDIPGHEWVMAGKNMFSGKHYNTGPFGASQWWSGDADDGELLYIIHGIIDEWTEDNAKAYAKKGYVHYHEMVDTETGEMHPTDVIWLKHTARTSFTLDGGPGAPNPPYEHYVTPGVDYGFPPNGMSPYDPD